MPGQGRTGEIRDTKQSEERHTDIRIDEQAGRQPRTHTSTHVRWQAESKNERECIRSFFCQLQMHNSKVIGIHGVTKSYWDKRCN